MFMRKFKAEIKSCIDLRLSKIRLEFAEHTKNILDREETLYALIRDFTNEVDPDELEIKIKYFEPGLEQIDKLSVGDWIDLRAAETVDIKAGEYKQIRLGVGMILPHGYEAHVLPRSSTAKKFGIIQANSMGIIDNSYSGDGDEWQYPAIAFRDTTIVKGDRIAQFRIMKNQPKLSITTVEHLNSESRGGFGSTGTR